MKIIHLLNKYGINEERGCRADCFLRVLGGSLCSTGIGVCLWAYSISLCVVFRFVD